MITILPTALTAPRERAWSTARAQISECRLLESLCSEPQLSARTIADLRRSANELRRRSYDKLLDTGHRR